MGMSGPITVLEDPVFDLNDVSPEAFLNRLGGPTAFVFTGRDTTRTRALVTLLHGNEPSGLLAVMDWLRSNQRSAVNILCVVASVATALESPQFSHRMLPGTRDLNRCFSGPFDDPPGVLARAILDLLDRYRPEAVIDMHNTSGSGPAFGVCTYADAQHDALVSLFTHRLIISNLQMGALMDISEHGRPTVTVEVGGRADAEAHALASEGLCRYFCEPDVLRTADSAVPVEHLVEPIRLELQEGVGLTYSSVPLGDCDITLDPDIERFNFGVVTPATRLGWAGRHETTLFRARDATGRCAINRLVTVRDGELYPAQPLRLFMATTSATIARADCLFYAVAEDGQSHQRASG